MSIQPLSDYSSLIDHELLFRMQLAENSSNNNNNNNNKNEANHQLFLKNMNTHAQISPNSMLIAAAAAAANLNTQQPQPASSTLFNEDWTMNPHISHQPQIQLKYQQHQQFLMLNGFDQANGHNNSRSQTPSILTQTQSSTAATAAANNYLPQPIGVNKFNSSVNNSNSANPLASHFGAYATITTTAAAADVHSNSSQSPPIAASHLHQQQNPAGTIGSGLNSQSAHITGFSGNGNLNPPVRQDGRMTHMKMYNKFGTLGAGKVQFNSPHGFCLGRNEEIVVADTNNNRIQCFDKEGNLVFFFGSPGRDDGQLWYPRKVAVNRLNGNFVICDRGAERSRMQIFNSNGHFIRKISIRYIDIVAGLVVNAAGEIVVADSVSPTVFRLSEDGQLLKWFDCSEKMHEPSDIAVWGDEYYVCDFKVNF